MRILQLQKGQKTMSIENNNTVSPLIPTSLPQFLARFRTEHDCRSYLMRQHSAAGFNCPSCANDKAWWNNRSGHWTCTECAKQVPLTAGTPMEGSKQPLILWFRAAWLVASQGLSLSARQLQISLKIERYEIAWDMLRRLRAAGHATDSARRSGTVEVDEAAICGEEFRLRSLPAGSGDMMVLGAAEVRGQRIGRVRLALATNLSSSTLTNFVETSVEQRASTVLTDELLGYRPLQSRGYEHISVVRPGSRSAQRQLPRVHRVFEDLSDWLAVNADKLEQKSISQLIHEYEVRFNRRRQPASNFQALMGASSVSKTSPSFVHNGAMGA